MANFETPPLVDAGGSRPRFSLAGVSCSLEHRWGILSQEQDASFKSFFQRFCNGFHVVRVLVVEMRGKRTPNQSLNLADEFLFFACHDSVYHRKRANLYFSTVSSRLPFHPAGIILPLGFRHATRPLPLQAGHFCAVLLPLP